MNYHHYTPPAELSHLIECFWSNTMYAEDFKQDHDFIIPDGSAEAVFMLNGSYFRDDEKNDSRNLIDQCSFVTPFRNAVKVFQKPQTSCVAVRFRPEAIKQMTGTSLGDLNQPVYPLQEVMPELADLAMNLVLKNSSSNTIIRAMIQWFLKQKVEIESNAVVSEFIRRVIRQKGEIGIENFCNEFNIHKSTLQKNFKHLTGYSPKEYAGVIRFNFLLSRVLYSPHSFTET
ncbi:MAG: DUF6597 domain-containing transcriptional factor, partial [Balneolaceae bacterium]|nr:DUF6597 domain-containing transcriptional factor [Balneolaceae bacterium]